MNYKFLYLLICILGLHSLTAQEHQVIDRKGTQITVTSSQVSTTSTAPSNPNEGDVWIDTASNTLKIWEEGTVPAWIEIASIRNWISSSQNGSYLVNHLVSYQGMLYKNLTASNSDTTPNLDTTNWKSISGGGVVPLWKSFTNGGSYAINDLINYNGALYKNLSATNSDTTPDLDASNWVKTTPEVINNLVSASTTDALSANEGRILNNLIQALDVLPESQRNIAYLQASHSVDHIFTATDTPETIPFDTNDEDLGITHSATVNNSEVTIRTSAIYTIITQPQVFSGTNNGTFRMWLQRDQGAGFVDVPNSNVEIILANNGEDVLPLASVGYLAKDDKIRLMGSVNNTAVILDAINPVGEPAVPAVILAMYANSTGVNIQKEVLNIVDASIAPPTSIINDIYILTNIGAIDPSWGSIGNLEENDVVVYTGTDWEVSLDVSTQFTKGEYQVYNTADGKIHYYTGVEWIVLGSATADIVPLWKSNTNGGSYAINDIINYGGSLYKNTTGTNTNTTPNLDTTNWKSISGGGVVPLWESLTNGGSYAINDVINYNGRLYKNKTGTNTDTTPDLDFTNWTLISGGGDIVPLWKSNTNGGSYAINDVINYNGRLYKNKTGTNTDTPPNSDATNWDLTSKNLGIAVTINNGLLLRHNWPSFGFNLGLNSSDEDVFYSDNPSYRLLEPLSGPSSGKLQIKATQTGVAGEVRKFPEHPEQIIVEMDKDGNMDLAGDLKTDTFSTAWVNNTNGGVYAVDGVVLYGGEFYRNRTGNNTNTAPPTDRTNWLALTNDLLIKVATNGNRTLTISNGATATQWNNVFDLEVIDSHNAFDLNTVTFTAPLNGWYELHSFFRINTAISVGNLYWSLNGNDAYSLPDEAIFFVDGSDAAFRSLSVYGIIYMNVGETLSLRNRFGGGTSIQINGKSTTIIKRIRD